MNQTKKCCWIIRPAAPGVEAQYCGKPTKYKMAEDDDGSKVRDYARFCEEHQAKFDALPEDEE